jgi:hypothetical protein
MLGKIFSFDAPTYVWQGFLAEVTKGWPITDWKEPEGIVHARVDVFSGLKPGPYSSRTVDEIFIKGTQPKKVDDTKVPGTTCSGNRSGVLDLSHVEDGFPASWQQAVDDWVSRARRGVGVKGGPNEKIQTATAYFAKPYFQPYGPTWGAPFGSTRDCVKPTPGPKQLPGGGGGGRPGHGRNRGTPAPTPTPTASASTGAGDTTWFAFVPFVGPLVGLFPLMSRRRGRRPPRTRRKNLRR